jgi:hypothetical protein
MKVCADCGEPWAGGLICRNCGCFDAKVDCSDAKVGGPPASEEPPQEAAGPLAEPPPYLVIEGGGRSHVLCEGQSCELGRDRSSPLVGYFELYGNVSAQHASIRVEAGQVFVIDRLSKNGTWLGEERLSSDHEHRLTLPATLRLAGNCFLSLSRVAAAPTREACA